MASSNSMNFEALIAIFFADHAKPIQADWKALIEAHPEHVDEIVDAAIAYGANKDISDIPDESFFDKGVFDSTISKVLSQAHKISMPLLEEVEQKVQSIKGPTARTVAAAIGLGSNPALLNGVLVGRTRAPRRVYELLEQYLDAPVVALSEVFRRQFMRLEAPAFKATVGQPSVRTEPCSWEEAVRELKLSATETDRLLKLAE